MKSIADKKRKNNLIDYRQINIASYSCNFNKIPPIIGIITADQFGNTIMIYEHSHDEKNNYGPIISYLKEDDKNLIELDLISMYFSSFKIFAGQTNIQNLSHLEIHGSNIKVQIFFLFDKYMIIVFLNSNTQLNSKDNKEIINFLKEKLTKHHHVFEKFNEPNSRKILRMLELKGRSWLKSFNSRYMMIHNENYVKKDEILEKLIEDLDPIIRTELSEYLVHMPEHLINDITLEIRNKVQDKLFNQINLIQ